MANRVLIVAVLALAAFGVAGGASADPPSETVYLDIQSIGGQPASVSSDQPLEAGRQYTLVVSGTVSIWPAEAWGKKYQCGTSEPFPQTPSPGRDNGPVGIDAEVLFAMTRPRSNCANEALPRPAAEVFPGRGVVYDLGSGSQRLVPRGGQPTQPTRDHAYIYDLVGQGAPLTATYTARHGSDDYGVLTLTIVPGPPPGSTATPAPVVVPTPEPVKPATRRGCKQRFLKVKVRNRRARRLQRGTALYANRHYKLRRFRKGLRGRLDVRKLGRRKLKVTFVTRTSKGRVVVLKRRYRICGR